MMQTILWRDLRSGAVERAVLAPDSAGYHIGGTALIPVDGDPIEIRYAVLADAAWRTRVVGVHVQAEDGNRRIALRGDGTGEWTSEDGPVPDLAGAVDVELTFTPATMTLPIRRLALAVGQRADITVVRIDPIRRETGLATRSYVRLADDRYRCDSPGDDAELRQTDDGLVRYPSAFETLARSEVGSAQ